MENLQNRFAFDAKTLISLCKKNADQDLSNQADALLDIRMKDIDSRWEKVEKSYEELMLSELSEEIKATAQEQYDSCVDIYYLTISKILNLVKPTKISIEARESIGPTLPNPPNSNFNSGLKLPPCDTQIFSGGYEDWPAFRDMFTAVYINHPRLTNAEKLYHLRNKTTDTAGAIVKRFTLTDDNFELAWNALKLRYENVRVLVDNQIRNLFNIPAAVKEDSESLQRIHSSVTDSLAMLKGLGVSTDGWDPMLVNLVYSKLPHETLAHWEQSLNASRKLPPWSDLSDFLLKRCEVVERISTIKITKSPSLNNSDSQSPIQMYASQEKINLKCKICEKDHNLRVCPQFRKLSIQERVDFIFKNQFCNNCLSPSHTKKHCTSKNTCLNCNKQHHTLLHMRAFNPFRKNNNDQFKNGQTNPDNKSDPKNSNNRSYDLNEADQRPSTSQAIKPKINANYATDSTNILLRTALVQIESRGELFTIRALIDPGSERTFLSEKIQKRLNLPSRKSYSEIVGIGGQCQTAEKECDIVLVSKIKNVRFSVTAIVLPKVTNQIPSTSFDVTSTANLSDLDLADPHFNISSPIDLVLGNDSERFINLDGIRRDVCGSATAYKTVFGWVLSGSVQTKPIFSFSTSVKSAEDNNLDKLIRKFWEQEEIPSARPISSEDEYCEQFYSQTTKRLPNGRYMVRLPFRQDFPETRFLGPSRFVALSQYVRLEQTLTKDPLLQNQYNEVLKEYITLDHMEETTSKEFFSNEKCDSFYLPHHAVVRPESKTTKVRVVFNASRRTKSGFSLNDVLYTGPTLQADLMTVIINWRFYKFVFNGDIQKMYRQILIDPIDRPFQRILFQKSPREAVKDYQMKTVTFGVNCAPFLAIRTLLQLASDSQEQFPKAAVILQKETYVDDILTGGHTIESALESQAQLIKTLESAGLLLKKITANNSQLLTSFPKEDLYDSDFLKFHDASTMKALGIRWNALTDSFSYYFEPIPQASQITKRKIVSSVAKLFDPAGWISPVVVKGKILIQQLWLEKIDWDDLVSPDSLRIWNEIITDLQKIQEIQIPRWIQFTPVDNIQIHGFCDASKLAYCAAIYIRIETSSSVVFSNLLVAKTKVAPLASITLPRLELSGSVMLAKLVHHTITSLNLSNTEIILWCDSSIVLGWLAKPPATWKEIYVANRIGHIHTLLPNAKWRHVPTHCNPADLGSRGCRPQDLIGNTLWWHGPAWLINPKTEWPRNNPLNSFKSYEKSSNNVIEKGNLPVPTSSFHISLLPEDILKRFSSYTRALRVLAYVFRYIRRFKSSFANPNFPLQYHNTELGQEEIKSVKSRLIMLAQKKCYQIEYDALLKSEPIPKNSSLFTLNPLLDQEGILRVNGRLANSSLPFKERFPIILPRDSRLCELYLLHLHEFLAHGECSLMCRMIQTEFYISRLKLRVKKVIRYCKTCIIYKKQACSQIMAALPPDRCTYSFPFNITGIDFAGPFELKSSTLRRAATVKGYVCVFVCFATKAIHLEPCSSLSTPAFQATFSRFIGRRGLPQKVVSDNGRNFVGANRTLRREFTTFINTTSQDIAQKYISHGFDWSFIPPQAPHMGGLWEAAVKSFKFHLKRVAGAYRFNFEEFTTLLARIEGVLNSRPISSLSEDPSDLTALTPGHFLRGGPIMSFPEQTNDNLSLINRWEKLKAIHHKLSLQWKEEYLKSMHKRYKWKFSTPNLKVGDFVVVMDDLLPPCEWRLGRIEKVHSGSDHHVRVVDVRTQNGTITRAITKLCYLPYNNS
ncbi:uncharacterized protein LOC135961390 [Calliphora vicina]|uniref:uncharacterized protein LOC135961390 n=1 Tax=Calliphora vicina TaxID=7373 RepID=UPI00325B6316